MIRILINQVNPCPMFKSVIVDTIPKLHDDKRFVVGVGVGEIPESDFKTFGPSIVIHNGSVKSGYTQIAFKESDKSSIMPFVPLINENLDDQRYKCDFAFVCTGSETQDLLMDVVSKTDGLKFKCFGMNPSISKHYCGTHFNEAKLFANAKHIILPSINVPAMLFSSYLGCKPYVYDKATFPDFIEQAVKDEYSPKYPIPPKDEIREKHTNFDRACEFLKKNGALELAKELLNRKNK